jgi:excisionase family DNA binding protein
MIDIQFLLEMNDLNDMNRDLFFAEISPCEPTTNRIKSVSLPTTNTRKGESMLKDYYTTGELAELCHVSPATIFRAITNNQLKAATTPGGHFRISKEDVKDFLDQNKIPYQDEATDTKKILIVEDNPVELRMFQRALGSDNAYNVRTTESGYEAGFLTQSFKPDLIILDVCLPDMNGRQVVRLLRSDPQLKRTRIVAITGNATPKEIKEIKISGIDRFLQKPIAPAALRAVVAELLK